MFGGLKTLWLFGLTLTLLASLAAAEPGCCWENECTCDSNCWEQCFLDPPYNKEYRNAYIKIYTVALGIRNLYAPCFKPHGTAYMMDAAVPYVPGVPPSVLYEYQRNLAAIVAVVQPVGDTCNPFCVSKFFRRFAYYKNDWPCRDRCGAFELFEEDPNFAWFARDSKPSWVGGGELLARHCFENQDRPGHDCVRCSRNELLVAFTNSPVFYNPPFPSFCGGNPYQCAAIGVGTSDLDNLQDWAQNGPIYYLPSDPVYVKAAYKIARCLKRHCCNPKWTNPNTWWPKPKQVLQKPPQEAELTYEYTTKDGPVKEFKGSSEEFAETVLKKFVDNDDRKGPKGGKVPKRG